MVSSASPAAQASDNEKRRKQQTMERAKAHHLSRQLQMRLQYARLKVEHGWQKQNLNEVENLYFHHSHLRGPKPVTVPPMIATQQSSNLFSIPQSNPTQSSLSFKLGASTLGGNSLNQLPSPMSDQAHSPPSPVGNTTSTASIQPSPAAIEPPLSTTSNGLGPTGASTALGDADLQVGPPEMVQSLKIANPAQSNPHILVIGTQTGIGPSSPLARDDQSPVDNLYSADYYPAVKPSRPRTQKAPSTPKSQSTLTPKDMYNFGTTSTLTYDSFWSSHGGSASTTPRSSAGPRAVEMPSSSHPGSLRNAPSVLESTSGTTSSLPVSMNMPPNLESQQNPGSGT